MIIAGGEGGKRAARRASDEEREGERKRERERERARERRERERGREAGSSHVRLDSRRQNVNLALTHYARSGCVALGVRYRQHSVRLCTPYRSDACRTCRGRRCARKRERATTASVISRANDVGKPKRDRSRELRENREAENERISRRLCGPQGLRVQRSDAPRIFVGSVSSNHFFTYGDYRGPAWSRKLKRALGSGHGYRCERSERRRGRERGREGDTLECQEF